MIKKPQNCIVTLNEERLAAIHKMATEIQACPFRGRGRSWPHCYASAFNGKVLEYALEDQGAILNPATFNHKNPETYAWDVLWPWSNSSRGLKTEVKRCPFIGTDKVFYDWKYPSHNNTFRKHLDRVELLIVGDFKKRSKTEYAVEWFMMTMVTREFNDRVNEESRYYDHSDDPCFIDLKPQPIVSVRQFFS